MAEAKKRVLLIEPNYANKYPPIGLMKISTYYKNRGGWEVRFFKGDLNEFVVGEVTDKCVADLEWIERHDWRKRREHIFSYIKTGLRRHLDAMDLGQCEMGLFLESRLKYWKDYYKRGQWKRRPEWDRVGVTTLFTFHWDITIETIEFAKLLVKEPDGLMVGGVLASLQPDEIEAATGVRPHVGILCRGDLDADDEQDIDNLPLDYSILDEIDYRYPMADAFYGYMTRGCIRRCAFCAVPILEPKYSQYIPLRERLDEVRAKYGDQKDLLLMDNNVLASKCFDAIIDDIVASGFGRGARFTEPDRLGISIRNLSAGRDERANSRRARRLMDEFYAKLNRARPDSDDAYAVYKVLKDMGRCGEPQKEEILSAWRQIEPIYRRHWRPTTKQRYVDFNQGVDARLFDKHKAEQLARIAIRPLRIAFDDMKTRASYERAIRLCAEAGLREFSNYLLYNFNDTPLDLYRRLRINVELCDELGVNIYSFPMKYHPIRKTSPDAEEDFSHNRNYVGRHWNRKHIRAIQAILNSTKGKVGRGKSFFLEAFGESEEDFAHLLEMPEVMIIHRFFFKWLDGKTGKGAGRWRQLWDKCAASLDAAEWARVVEIVHRNDFSAEAMRDVSSADAMELMEFYADGRKDVATPGTELHRLKAEYDAESKATEAG